MTDTSTPRRDRRSKVNAGDWVAAGRKALCLRGVEAVSIERIARQLGVSRGSFYWHFESREDFLDTLLRQWRDESTLAIIDRIELTDAPAGERLYSLMSIAFTRDDTDPMLSMELAIRQWGRSNAQVRSALENVDRLRLDYFERLFVQAGFDQSAARTRAQLANSFMRVAPSLPDGRRMDDLHDAIAVLLIGAAPQSSECQSRPGNA